MLAVTPPTSPEDFKFVLDDLTEGLLDAADGPLLAAGNNLWLGLASIIVVWTGLRTAFSGEGFQLWEFVKLIILLSIPRGMLLFYDTPFPGMTLTFPEIIIQQGSWINGVIVGDTGSEVWEWIQDYLSGAWNTLADQATRYYGLGIVLSFITAPHQMMVLFVLGASALLSLVTVLVGYTYILFAQIAMAILTLFGPLFIPWMIFGPLSFLFWSWLRALITYSLYAAVAAAVFRIMMQLIMVMGDAYQSNANPDEILAALSDPAAAASGLGAFIVWTISYFLALLTALLASFKIPEIAASLVSGSAAGGGVAGAAVTAGAAVKGGAAAGRVAGKATGG
ncbi:MAG: type IV secretion system protein [Rhodospirillales bacterium]|nr:type IV secretion system protein [Rhodospirillales bacterium]